MKHTTVTPAPTVSVHDPSVRAPSLEVARLVQALDQFQEVAGDQSCATKLLEREVAAAVGKAAAVLVPTGKMAQQIALRVHADRRCGRRVVVAHPANHLSVWEDANYAVLHDLQVRPVGDRYRLLTTEDVAAGVSSADVAAALWELPQRELGGELPPWQQLQDQLAVTSAAGVATHLDGARVWQTGPFYGRPLQDICCGFESVYVSLYKDLAAPRGAILAGDEDFIATARAWRHRLGGTIDDAWPLALLALQGLRRVPPAMPRLVSHAQSIAAAIQARTAASVRPAVPQASMFHVHLPVSAESARQAHEQITQAGGLGLTLRIRTAPDPGRSWFEMTIGESVLLMSPQRIADAVARLLSLAGSASTHRTTPRGDIHG